MNAHHDKKMPNNTGIPDKMKKDFEERSRVPLDNVRVYRNSPLPERYGALAFSKGDSIYIKSGEERYLEHEIVHQIQAAQGMVEAKERINGEAFNQNPVLEDEAERGIVHAKPPVMQKKQETIQRKIGMEFQTYGGNRNVKRLKKQQGLDNQALIEAFNNCVNSNGDIDSMLEPAERDTILDFSRRAGYRVTADGPDLEYITNAFNETDKDKLVNAVSQAAEQHKEYTGTAGALAFAGGKYYCVDGEDGVYCIYKDGEKTAHPQATVGIKYEKIPDLIKKITDARPGDILYQERKESKRRNLTEAKKSADLSILLGKVRESSKCRAWIALVEEYIIAANSRVIRDEERKKAETEAIEAFRREVFFRINEAYQLQEFHDRGGADINIRGGRSWMNQVAGCGKLFLDDTGKSENLKQYLESVDEEHKELLSLSKKITDNKKKIESNKKQQETNGAQQDEKKARIEDIKRQISKLQESRSTKGRQLQKSKEQITRSLRSLETSMKRLQAAEHQLTEELQQLQALADKKSKQMRLVWENFQLYGNRLILEIQTAASKKAGSWPKYQKEDGRDTYVYLAWYYHKLKRYIDAWPQIKRSAELISMAQQIIENKPVNSERYFKTLLPVKSRTSFYDLYVLLHPNDQAYVINYLKSKYPHDALIEEDTTNCTTLRDWLDAMESGVSDTTGRRDIVNYELENGAIVGDGDYDYMNGFGVSRSTDIGHDGAGGKVEGALLELRRLKDKLLPNTWAAAAAAVADIVAEVNREKPVALTVPQKSTSKATPNMTIPRTQHTSTHTLSRGTPTGAVSALRRPPLSRLPGGIQ